jgi:hypothetical protein
LIVKGKNCPEVFIGYVPTLATTFDDSEYNIRIGVLTFPRRSFLR